MSVLNPTVNPSREFAELMAQHQGRLRGYVLSLVSDFHAADDVLQETNLVLCKKAGQFTPGTNFAAWSFRVAYFEVMRYRRNMRRDQLLFDEGLLEKVAAEAEAEDEHYAIRRAALAHCLRKLTERQRQLIIERYFHRTPVSRMAEESNQKANAISQALFRARQSLADCVNLAVPAMTARNPAP